MPGVRVGTPLLFSVGAPPAANGDPKKFVLNIRDLKQQGWSVSAIAAATRREARSSINRRLRRAGRVARASRAEELGL